MKNIPLALGVLFWFSTVTFGIYELAAYSNAPCPEPKAPETWPADASIVRNAGKDTLLLFAHPKCPCTRATMGELAILLTRAPDRCTTTVLFYAPDSGGEDWLDTDLWRDAKNIPGVRVVADRGGVEARRFHVETSGEALVYDKNGSLVFSGGITASRGHAGDNPGRESIEQWLLKGRRLSPDNPVFGCSLLTPCGEQNTNNQISR
ncbi:MAG: RedB protein [Planctomycetes bacterium]|nr:RedB protein [Planctomycetota bacterium]